MSGELVHEQGPQGWAEPDWRVGHVVRDDLGDVYAWTGVEGRPWVLLAHHHADTDYLVGAPAVDDWVWRPVTVLSEPVQP